MTAKHLANVLLDSNVWRYVVDHAGVGVLAAAARKHRVAIQIAPSVLYEALRTADAEVRQKLAHAMTNKSWHRLMPEAYEECMEVRAAVERLRPGWLRAQPDHRSFWRLRNDWTATSGGFWDRVRHETGREAATMDSLDGGRLELARALAHRNRDEARQLKIPPDPATRGNLRCRLLGQVPGWDGDSLEHWRASGLLTTSAKLRAGNNGRNPRWDWLSPFVDIPCALASGASWVRFWLYEVQVQHMPRHWIRSAMEALQIGRKVTDGTPADNQLAPYLVECDWFVTADRALHGMLLECRRIAPVQFGAPELIPAGEKAVEALFALLASLSGRTRGKASPR